MAQREKKWHKLTELAGVVMGIVLINFSTQVQQPMGTWLFIFGIVTIIVDSYFLYTWR